jgi:uncharacterized membrane protein
MNEHEQIKQIQEELTQLNAQLKDQQQKIAELHQRLMQLTGAEKQSLQPSSNQFSRNRTVENFIGLRLIHLVGIVVLVIGLSIGVKYAIDRNLISEAMRIGLAYGAGVVLYALSLQLKKKYSGFSAILFSGALASLYFTTYAAFVYYNMISSAVAFVIMVLLTAYTVWQAIAYDRQEIALLGLVGAYAIPFLISKNADKPELFFLYISLINIGAAFLSIKKLWKYTARAAQIITWLLFVAWAAIRFKPEFKATGFLFMSFFFLLFFFIVIAFKTYHKQKLTFNDTLQLLFNNVALYIGALFVFGYSFANADLAEITIIMSGFVALQAILFYYLWRDELFSIKVLSYIALGLFVLFIALQWSGFTVTLLWLLVAVIVFTWGVISKSVSARLAAIILLGITLGKLVALDSLTFTPVQKVIAYIVLGVLLLVISFFYQKLSEP